jgi:hypothetical protein
MTEINFPPMERSPSDLKLATTETEYVALVVRMIDLEEISLEETDRVS